MPKYVASRTMAPGPADWNATVLDGDAVDAVEALKSEDGGDLLKFGTGSLSRDLLARGLVDEYHFWMFPVVGATGTRLFEGVDLTHLRRVGVTELDSGITILVFAPKD